MGLSSKTLSGFWNGVSQQAPTARRENQCELIENMIGTLVDGLIKRPNTEHLSTLTSNAGSGCFVHRINRDTNDRYIVIFTDDSTDPIEVYKIDGTKCTVRYGTIAADGTYTADATKKAYAQDSDPATNFHAVTVADYTFIVNRSKTVAMDSATVGGTITGTVQGYADLPATPGANAIYEIAGDDTNNFDNFYMIYSGGVWTETVKPGIEYKLDEDTMPHRLVMTDTNEFTFAPCIWGDRTAGDEDSVLTPSFVDQEITCTFFYKNRLGFLSYDSCLMSRSGGYFDFFRRSAIDIHDDDPIDTSAAAKDIQVLRSVAVFDKSLMLLADQQQFDLSSDGGPLSPKTVTITPTTAFPIDKTHEPVTAGANVYFVSPKNKYMSIREYFIQPDSLTNDAADVTAHIPKYILNGTPTMECVNSMDMIFVHSDTDSQNLFVYKYFWNGDEKAQSAWQKWSFDGDVLGFRAIDTVMYILIKRDTEVCLEKIDLENVETGDLIFRIHLDRLVELDGTYNATENRTEWDTPYVDSSEDYLIIDPDSGLPLESVSRLDTNTLIKSGDHTSKTYYVGKNYTGKFQLTEWYLKTSKGVAITEGVLKVRSLTLSYTDTGPFTVTISAVGRDPLVHHYSGVVAGISEIGSTSLLDGNHKFPVLADARNLTIEVTNDSYLPTAFQSGMLEGWFHARSNVM